MDLIQSINEKRNTFSADTFRPSESQKAVLLAMDQIAAGDRAMKKADVTTSANEEKAFDALINLKLIEIDRHDKAILTSAGSQVVENIKAADPELAGEEDMDLEAEPTEEEPPMENFKLLKGLNNILTEKQQLDEMSQKSVFTEDDLKFLKLFSDGKADLEDSPDLLEKLMDFYADEMPYGTVTGDDEIPSDWIFDRIDKVIDEVKFNMKK